MSWGTLQSGGAFDFDIISSTTRGARLDVMLHAADRLWLDWKDGPAEFGWAEHDGLTWVPRAPAGWTDPSWVGVEGTRKVIASQASGP